MSNESLSSMREQLIRHRKEDEIIHNRRKRMWIIISIMMGGAAILGGITIPRFVKYYKALEAYRSANGIYDAAYYFSEAKINNSDDWSDSINYAIGMEAYSQGNYEQATNCFKETTKHKDHMVIDSAIAATQNYIEWGSYDGAIEWLEIAENAAEEQNDSSYDSQIAAARDQLEYLWGKEYYDQGDYETAAYHLRESRLSQANSLLSNAENYLEVAENDDWRNVNTYYNSDIEQTLRKLYDNNPSVLEQCYTMFGNERDNLEITINDLEDDDEAVDTIYSPASIYCHYFYTGDEDVTFRTIYVYADSTSDYVFDDVSESYDSGWLRVEFGETPTPGYYYVFFFNYESGEPLSANRVLIQ